MPRPAAVCQQWAVKASRCQQNPLTGPTQHAKAFHPIHGDQVPARNHSNPPDADSPIPQRQHLRGNQTETKERHPVISVSSHSQEGHPESAGAGGAGDIEPGVVPGERVRRGGGRRLHGHLSSQGSMKTLKLNEAGAQSPQPAKPPFPVLKRGTVHVSAAISVHAIVPLRALLSTMQYPLQGWAIWAKVHFLILWSWMRI